MDEYFADMDTTLTKAYALANAARAQGYDPVLKVEIPIAKDMAERVEGIISTVAPNVVGKGIPERIRELEKQYGVLDWRVSLIIAEEVAFQKFCTFKDKIEAMEIGIRVGFAYHTLGTVASPLEGFTNLKVRKRRDGKEYLAVYYSGPIRSAGGTGASVSVLIVDYVRKKMGYDVYDPTEEEVKRTVTELYDYHERITNLQYLPSEEEIVYLFERIPVQIDGDPSEQLNVSNYKGLPRIETDKLRNGVCLTIGEGLAQKAPKVWKQLSKWGKDFDLEQWNFMGEFVEIQKKIKAKGQVKKESKVSPDHTFIKDLPAGRPILTYPMAFGGFRLRYGRSRTSGYSSCNISPLTMSVLNDYIAVGTQLKMERPGKAATVTSCDIIEGPIVKLQNGDVVRIESEQQSLALKNSISKILFLGDILVSYGDFFNRAHPLVPPGYCEEWWVQEWEKAIVTMFGSMDLEKAAGYLGVEPSLVSSWLSSFFTIFPGPFAALKISTLFKIPLHPYYTHHFRALTNDTLIALLHWMEHAELFSDEEGVTKIVLPVKDEKKHLEDIGLPHKLVNNEFVVIEKNYAQPLLSCLGISSKSTIPALIDLVNTHKEKTILDILYHLSLIPLRDKSGMFIGARMGRPEKAKVRELTGSPQVLFPVGDEGGRMRSFQSALQAGKIQGDFPTFYCETCKAYTIFQHCMTCNNLAKRKYYCDQCGVLDTDHCTHGEAKHYQPQEIPIALYFEQCLKKLNLVNYPDLIKGVRGTSNDDHTSEHLMKGILRAKHDIYVNKDGTTRYDMTQLPITHFKPNEVGATIDQLKKIGYTADTHGKPLENGDQVLELFPQDIILPAAESSPDRGADEILMNVANFVDDELKNMYGLDTFYNLTSSSGLIGQLVLVLAPHTSAGIVGRIVGFSHTQGFLAHPLVHAATRRDCDGDEASVILLMDALLNFSRTYLPSHRGSSQDAPLVLTSHVIPTEVDDMVFDVDIAWRYPLDFYEACMENKAPWEVDIKRILHNIQKGQKYLGLGYTHEITSINSGVLCSAYKTLPSMEEKLRGQMDIAEKICAVDAADVARLVIEKHFIKDTKGNLRKYSMQQFRCISCNDKFRRPPLLGKCSKCGGRLIFTISEGSVTKYLGPSLSLAEKYNLPAYLRQGLMLLQKRIESVFGREKEKQEGLGRWFG